MSLLIVLTAVLLGASAALKLRSMSRRGMGPSPLALLEALAAIGLLALTLTGSPPLTVFVRWSIPAAVVILIASSIDHALRLGRRRREREQSEARRLATFVRYPTDRGGAP